MKNFLIVLIFVLTSAQFALAQAGPDDDLLKAEQIIKAAVSKLGGEKYVNLNSVITEGRFTITQDNKITSSQTFVDVLVYPDRERTDFKEKGSKTVQVNANGGGWVYQEFLEKFFDQNEKQIEGFERSLRTHYDFLLRGRWKGVAELSYKGRRQASIGKSNYVLRLDFEDEFWVEYEFGDDGFPMKTVYSSLSPEGAIVLEENRYAQFILIDGIFYPFVVDHFTDSKSTYRVNYIEVRFNRNVPDSIFDKPANPKQIKKLNLD